MPFLLAWTTFSIGEWETVESGQWLMKEASTAMDTSLRSEVPLYIALLVSCSNPKSLIGAQ